MSFRLSKTAIDPSVLIAGLSDTRAGACVTFEGRVRGRNQGKRVRALDYESYGPLAEREGDRILKEARARFKIRGAACVHRTGSLNLGDIAVWIAVTAEHRGPAFEACSYIINETKARVPIWKKERYADGASEWINCAARPGMPADAAAGPAPGRKGKGAKSRRAGASASARHK